MLTLKEQAEVCRIGLITGLLSKRDVTAWADSIIDTDDSPNSNVIDISLMGSADLPSLVSATFDVNGEGDPGKIINVVLGLCADKLRHGSLTADEVAAVLDRLAPDMSCRRCNIRAEYGTFVDANTAAVIRSLLNNPNSADSIADFLAPYAGYATEITLERA